MPLELVAAVASSLVALAALAFSIYSFKQQQGRADAHAKASVKPLLSIKSETYVDRKSIRLVNYGVGPAIIRKAEFRRDPDDEPTNRIVDLFELDIVWESFVNLPIGSAIPAEGEIVLVKESLDHLAAQCRDGSEDEQRALKKALAILDEWQRQKSGILVYVEYENIYGDLTKPPLAETLK